MIALGNRVHTFAHPSSKDRIVEFFTGVLGCEVLALPAGPGLPSPAIAFSFPGGGALSFEFTGDALDEHQARRAPYLDLKVVDPAALKEKIVAAGLRTLEEYTSNHFFYFQAPGGQVMRIVPIGER